MQGRWFTATLLPQPLTEEEARTRYPHGVVFVTPEVAKAFDRANAEVNAGSDAWEVITRPMPHAVATRGA